MLTKLHMNSVATESAIARKLQKAANIKVYNANPIHVQQKSSRNRLEDRDARLTIWRQSATYAKPQRNASWTITDPKHRCKANIRKAYIIDFSYAVNYSCTWRAYIHQGVTCDIMLSRIYNNVFSKIN